jgi:hypothetical protein
VIDLVRVLTCLPLALALACTGAATNEPGARGRALDRPVVGSSDADMTCSEDSDCVLVERGPCCGCSGGGRRGVVRADRLEAVKAAQLELCGEEVICTTEVSGDPSCIGMVEAVCAARRCMIRPPRR